MGSVGDFMKISDLKKNILVLKLFHFHKYIDWLPANR